MTTKRKKVALPTSAHAKRLKKKPRSKAKLQLVEALQGVWTFKDEKPVPFKFLRKGSGLALRLEVPPTMGERAYRALFRFLLFNFQHLRTKIPYWLKPDYQAALRQIRRKRWRSRRRKRRHLRNPPPIPVPTTPPEEETSVGPSGDLQAIAKQVLKGAKK
jgi:hypothetical protein